MARTRRRDLLAILLSLEAPPAEAFKTHRREEFGHRRHDAAYGLHPFLCREKNTEVSRLSPAPGCGRVRRQSSTEFGMDTRWPVQELRRSNCAIRRGWQRASSMKISGSKRSAAVANGAVGQCAPARCHLRSIEKNALRETMHRAPGAGREACRPAPPGHAKSSGASPRLAGEARLAHRGHRWKIPMRCCPETVKAGYSFQRNQLGVLVGEAVPDLKLRALLGEPDGSLHQKATDGRYETEMYASRVRVLKRLRGPVTSPQLAMVGHVFAQQIPGPCIVQIQLIPATAQTSS